MLLASQSQAAEITFKLRDQTEKPVQGRVEMSVPGKEVAAKWVVIVNATVNGEGKLPNAKCDPPGILFRAFSYDQTYYLELTEMLKGCVVGEIIFHFRRKEYAGFLTEALSTKSPTIAAASPDAQSLQASLLQALNTANYSAAAKNSMLLHDKIQGQLGPKAAEPFRILADDLAASSITNAQALTFDPQQGKYVLSGDAIKAIAEFQKANKLHATGTIDWNTATHLPNLETLSASVPTIEYRM